MGTVVVVLGPPVGDEDLGLEKRVELFDGEQLVAHARAVGLHPRVLPGGAGVDVAGAGTVEATPVPNSNGGELRAVEFLTVVKGPSPVHAVNGTRGVSERLATPFLTRSSRRVTLRSLEIERRATRISRGIW